MSLWLLIGLDYLFEMVAFEIWYHDPSSLLGERSSSLNRVLSPPARPSGDEETDHKYHDARRGVEEPDDYSALGEVLRAFSDHQEGDPATSLPSAATADYQHPEQKRPSDDVSL